MKKILIFILLVTTILWMPQEKIQSEAQMAVNGSIEELEVTFNSEQEDIGAFKLKTSKVLRRKDPNPNIKAEFLENAYKKDVIKITDNLSNSFQPTITLIDDSINYWSKYNMNLNTDGAKEIQIFTSTFTVEQTVDKTCEEDPTQEKCQEKSCEEDPTQEKCLNKEPIKDSPLPVILGIIGAVMLVSIFIIIITVQLKKRG